MLTHLAALVLAGLITTLTFLLLPWVVSLPVQPERQTTSGFTTVSNLAEPESTEPESPTPSAWIEPPIETPPPPIIPDPVVWTPPPEPVVDASMSVTLPTPEPVPETPTRQTTPHATPPSEGDAASEPTAPPDSTPDTRPRIVHRPRPPYPRMAKFRSIEGHVDIRLSISASGTVETVEILAAKPQGMFEDTVRRTVRLWRFSPARRDGAAVPSVVETRILFELR